MKLPCFLALMCAISAFVTTSVVYQKEDVRTIDTKVHHDGEIPFGFFSRFHHPHAYKATNLPDIDNADGRIIGGSQAAYGEYPWQVKVDILKRDWEDHCGAVIIDKHWLLSAAHCYKNHGKDRFRFLVGDYRVGVKDTHEQQLHAEYIVIHPKYDSSSGDYDFALIKVKSMNFNKYVNKVDLPESTTPTTAGTRCVISGWGRLYSGGPVPEVLQAAVVPLMDQKTCKQLYQQNNRPIEVTDRMICTGYSEGGINTCNGDSGGPLVCNTRGKNTLIGVTSWGIICGDARHPAVFARVSSVLPWIYSTMRK